MSIAYKISAYNRARKWRIFTDLIKPSKDARVLDVGYTEYEYGGSENYLEKHYPYPDKVTALGVEEPEDFLRRYPEVNVVTYNGNDMPFDDGEFDVCWSNAVIEHVGETASQVKFLEEIKRVSKVAFITTPNKYFPVEVHTRTPLLHLLPKDYFDKYLKAIGKEWAAGDYMNLLSCSEIKSLMRDAGISEFRVIKNRLFFFTLDFIMIF